MKITLQRLTAFFLVLVMCVGMLPTVMAAELEETTATEPEESATAPPESESSEDTSSTEETVLEDSFPEDAEASLMIMSLDDGIATVAETEIVGAPNAFANLFLLNGGVDIPSFDHVQHKEHIPLYSVYLKNQPGYENNYYVAYCIEPGVVLGNSGGHSGSSTTIGGMTDGSGALTNLTRDQVSAIGVALLYGETEIARRADEESVRLQKLRRHAATQVIVWEIACGWRSSVPPYTRNDSTLYDAICPELEIASDVWNTKFYIDGIDEAYDEIVAQMAQHYVIPSFASDELSFASTYELTPDNSGKYSVTLTDTNNILSKYTFTNTDQLTFTVSGNKLTITASSPISETVVAPTKQVPSLDNQVFYVWEYQEQQKLMSCKSEPANDPVPAYFKVTTSSGSLSLKKTTEDGKNLAGWKFSIYADQNCTTLISGPHETDANGNITVSNLSAGTVWVKEIGHKDAAVNALYKCDSTNPQKVTITAGKTASVSFYNKLNTGACKIVKTATNGGTVAGWHFEVKDSSGNVIGNYVTDETGIITLTVTPGSYTVTETDGAQKYWVNDPNPTRTVTVKAGETATVEFKNQWNGQAQIVKTATNGGSVAGWHFEVKDSAGNVVGNYATDETGVITQDIEPGVYTITETDGESAYWHNDPNPTKTVTVKAGETVKVVFENQWVGKAKIIKTATNGGSVEGWEFTITDAEGNKVGTYKTDSAGTIVVDLEPGQYTISESDRGDPYWYCDTEPQTVTVKAGETATVIFQNQWIGKAKIIKILENPEAGSVEGWTFTIHKVSEANGAMKADYLTTVTTGADGTILYDLEPGDYLITEELAEDSLWQCVSERSQLITVKAGQTAQVVFKNALRPGEIRIQKVDTKGAPLEGVEFLLEWSEDGTTWQAVTFTDSAVPQIGGCTTQGLVDGKLVSDSEGLVTFSGLYPTLQYRLTETATKDGYQLLSGAAYEGGLNEEDDFTVSVKVVNAEIFNLPKTGSNSLALMPISIGLCLAVCIGAIFYLRKKKE